MAKRNRDEINTSWDLNGGLPVTPAEADLVVELMAKLRTLSGTTPRTQAPVLNSTIDDKVTGNQE